MKHQPLKPTVLITAGPTRAYLDDVRYLSNYSTGELGFELAHLFRKHGWRVLLIAGPTSQPYADLKLTYLCEVETVEEMLGAVARAIRRFRPSCAIFSAAVLDFEPERRLRGKVSSRGTWILRLRPTPKIIDEVGRKFPRVRRIGFKLEPSPISQAKLRRLAVRLLKKKQLEAVCINFFSEIRGKRHPAHLFWDEGRRHKRLVTKRQIAQAIVSLVS